MKLSTNEKDRDCSNQNQTLITNSTLKTLLFHYLPSNLVFPLPYLSFYPFVVIIKLKRHPSSMTIIHHHPWAIILHPSSTSSKAPGSQ
jgi:hypothetical protein